MLTIKQIDSAKPKEKSYRVADSGGLFLFVPPTGKKVWRLRYRFDGREKTLALGSYPQVSLAEARAKQSEAKLKISNGIDPSEEKKMCKRSESNSLHFSSIYHEWYEHKRKVWSEGYAQELGRMFSDDILPLIGDRNIDEIEPMQILSVIRHFENRGAMERANKARRRCGEVFRYAIVTGRAKYNPAPDLADAMKGYRKKNYPFLPADQIPAFNKALEGFTGSVISRIATQILQYTAMRTKEMRSMQWENVDIANRLIRIDEGVMKGRREHLVPMSDQVLSLIEIIRPMTEPVSDFVFAGRVDKKKPISENSVLQVIRQIGYEGIASGHGFRHQFSTVLNEHGWPHDAIERQLAHSDSNSIRGIYNHAQYLEKRREMMQWWANWIDGTQE